LNLNVHFHMLVPDGVYQHSGRTAGRPQFVRIPAPDRKQLQALVERISERVGRQLQRRGILVREAESSHLELKPEAGEDALPDLQGHSITYRVAFGARQGQKVFTLQTLPPRDPEQEGKEKLAQANGFSLHAGVAAEAGDRPKLERLCRYISRPAISAQRLSVSAQGNIRYALKTPYRDGTTHVMFEPLDFLSRLAALVPAPRVNLTRFHGVFAPHHRWRALIVPGPRDEDRDEPRDHRDEAGEGREAGTQGQRGSAAPSVRIGLDPLLWTPQCLRSRSQQWRRKERDIRRNSAGKWSNWYWLAERTRSWRGSSDQLIGRSGNGSNRLSEKSSGAMPACQRTNERSFYDCGGITGS
jgi:hypothetical protein